MGNENCCCAYRDDKESKRFLKNIVDLEEEMKKTHARRDS
jgi:hypothetical protein